MTLIALKREVAVEAKAFAGFPWSECQVVKTGDKSLYESKTDYYLPQWDNQGRSMKQRVSFSRHTRESVQSPLVVLM